MSRDKRTPEQRATTVREYWLELCHATVAETAAKARAAQEKSLGYTGNSEARLDGLMERAEMASERAENEAYSIAAAFDGHDECDDAPPIMPTEQDAARLALLYGKRRVTCAAGSPGTVEKLGRRFAALIRDAERWERTGRKPDIIADTRGESRDRPERGCLSGCLRRLGVLLLWAIGISIATAIVSFYLAKS